MGSFGFKSSNMYISPWNRIWELKAQDFIERLTEANDKNLNEFSLNGFNHSPDSIFSEESFEEYLRFVSKELMLNSHSYIYEFGCGSGYFLNSLAKICGSSKFSGSDSSDSMIMIAKTKFPNFHFEVNSADDFKSPELGGGGAQ